MAEYKKVGEKNEFICLQDADGNRAMFDFLALAAANGKEYAALLMQGDKEVTVLRLREGDNGSESYFTIDDDDEFDLACEVLSQADGDLFI